MDEGEEINFTHLVRGKENLCMFVVRTMFMFLLQAWS